MTRLLSALAAAVRRAPVALIVGVLVLTGVFGAATANYSVDDQGFENFAPDNEVTEALTVIRDEFGAGFQAVQFVVESEEGPLLGPDGVRAAAEIRQRLDDDATVSAALAPLPEGTVITYADLVLQAAAAQQVDPTTLSAEEIASLHAATAEQLPAEQAAQVTRMLAKGEPDAELGAVVVLLDGELTMAERNEAVRAAADAADDVEGVEVSALDFALLGDEISDEITADLGRLLLLAFGLIIVILVSIYRRPLDVIASLLGLGFTIVWMQGSAALLGPDVLGWTGGTNEMTMAIPILLVGLGVDYGIHLTMRYREERAHGTGPSPSATAAIGAVGTALALATITTVVGFLTNVTNPLPPLRDFGIFAAVGVTAAFLIFLTFVPAVRVLADQWLERRGRGGYAVTADRGPAKVSWLGRLTSALAPTATHRPWVVLTAAGVLTVAGALGATQLSTEFSQTEFFPEDSEALRLIETVEEEFGGSLTETTQVLVRGDIDRPGVLAAVHEAEQAAVEVTGVRSTDDGVSGDSILQRSRLVLAMLQDAISQAEAAEAPATGAQDPMAQADPDAVQAFLAAAEQAGIGSGDGPSDEAELRPLADALIAVDPTAASLVTDDALLIEFSSSVGDEVDEMREELEAVVAPLEAAGLTAVAASDPILVDIVMDELQSSQITGLVYTLAAAAVILAIAFWFRSRQPVLGILAIGTVGVVVAWVYGLMAAVGIPFNVMTAMVSALAIGIGVPYGIHVVNRFLEDRARFDDMGDAMRSTLQNTGGALVGSALTTIAGFGSLSLSDIRPFQQFGAVLAMTIGLALVASVVVLPALLSVYSRVALRRVRRQADQQTGDRATIG